MRRRHTTTKMCMVVPAGFIRALSKQRELPGYWRSVWTYVCVLPANLVQAKMLFLFPVFLLPPRPFFTAVGMSQRTAKVIQRKPHPCTCSITYLERLASSTSGSTCGAGGQAGRCLCRVLVVALSVKNLNLKKNSNNKIYYK